MRKDKIIKLFVLLTIIIAITSVSAFIIYAATGDILPDDGAVITSAQITSMITGTAPFDTSERDGRDISPDDDIVRSMDQVTYTVEATMAINGTDSANYKGGDIYIEAKIPQDCTYEEWDISSMAWAEVVSISDDRKIVTLKYSMDSAKVTIPGKQELSMIMKVGGEKNGTQVQPTFKVWLQGNDTDESSETYEAQNIVSEIVTVTSKPKYNVRLKKNSELNNIVTIDIDGVPTKGRLYGFITTLQLYNDTSERALKGVEYPSGDISFDIEMYMEKYDSEGNFVPGLDEKVTPILYNYSVNYVDKTGVIPDKPMNIVSDKTASGRLVAPRGTRDIYYNATEKRIGDSIYNSGTFSCTQDGNTLHIVNSGYQFDGVFPVRNSEYDGLPINYDPNEGCFAAGYFQIFVPFTEDTQDANCTYGLSITDSNFSATSISGVATTEQRRTSDDSVYIDFYQKKAGSFWTNVTIRDTNKEYVHSDYDKGDGYGFKGQKLWLVSRLDSSSRNDSDLEIRTLEHLLKFDDECFEPIEKIGEETWYASSTHEIEYKMYYAAKADGTGWTSDTEMEAAKRTDLVYYESLDSLKADNKICVGFLAESQSGTLYADDRTNIYFPVKVKNTSEIGSVYQVVNDYELYTDVLDRTLYYATNPDNTAYPEADYESGDEDYIKTAYDENGVQIGGTHNLGAEIGNSLLVIEADTNVKIETSQLQDNVPKINYDFGKNEYQVDYKVTPYIMIPDTVDTINSAYSQNIVVRAYVPSIQANYIPGSCEFGDPTIYVETDSDGIEYSVLEWVVPDCKINEEVNPIYFSLNLNPQLSNNDQVTVKATTALQDGDKLRPELKQDSYTVQIINLSSHRLYKEVEKTVVDKEEQIHFKITYINSTDKEISDFQMLDILPYNGDSRGTSYDGTYTIESVNVKQLQGESELSNDNLQLYLSNSEDSRNIDSKDTNIGVTSEWENELFGTINKDATAIALKGVAAPTSQITLDIVMQPRDNIGGNKYVNSASAQTDVSTAEIVSSTCFASVVARKIEGTIWYDKNINGIIDSEELKISNVIVTINNSDGSAVVDTLGNSVVTTTTDENGYYCFEKLKEGTYNIKVSLANEYIGFTDKLIGKDPAINSHVDSDGSISGIELKDTESSYNLVVANQNAGMIKQFSQIKVLHVLEGTDVSNPESVLNVLYNTETLKGEIGDSYIVSDRLNEINLSHDEEYEVASVSGNTEGTFIQDTQYVIYFYRANIDLPSFDLSLRKYITRLNGDAIVDRIPNIVTQQLEMSKVGYKRSVFSWSESEITDSADMIKIANLFGLTEVYQYIPHELFSSTETTLADFVTKLENETNNNMKVTYLAGDASWYAKPDSIKRRINYLLTYNSGTGKDAPIDTIALDIEPWTLGLTEDYSATFKATLEEIYPYAKENGIKIVMVIPFWLDTSDDIADKTLYTSIIENSDEVVIMNYNQNAYYTAMDNEIQASIDNGKIIYSAAELQAPNDTYGVTDNLTYYEDGLKKLFEDWRKLEDKYPDYNELSFSFHNINSLKILLDKDKINGTFKYNHLKQPLKVETNDLVEYTISIYNEGNSDGILQSIVDILPDGLEYVSIDENYNCVISDDGRILTINPNSTITIPAFNGITLSQVNIKVTCRVSRTKNLNEQILTNVAYINADSCIFSGIDVSDIDSNPNIIPNITDLSIYTGNINNKSDLNDSNYYYKGQEDDDDFEKVYLEPDLSYKITTEVNGVGGTISGQNDDPYELVLQGEDSLKDLIITPEKDYEVSNITINGVDITFTEDSNGIVILPKFENMSEDKHIIVTFELIKGKVTVTKVDKDDANIKLADATFKIEKIDSEGNVDETFTTQEKTTGSEGTIEFTELLVGKYRITETKAPIGYELAKEPLEFEITRNQKDLSITATDKLKLELPETGAKNYTIIIAAIGLSIMIISILLRRCKSNKKLVKRYY
ncbi:MAG: SpaA isopeptide-forming pilin-related protein [Clostridia bacterium]